MHELSLAGGILQLVERAQLRERFVGVESLCIGAGALAGVDVRALRFALEAMAPGTVLEGTRICIDVLPGLARCTHCEREVEVSSRAEPCLLCGSYGLIPISGTDLRIVSLTVQDSDTGGEH